MQPPLFGGFWIPFLNVANVAVDDLDEADILVTRRVAPIPVELEPWLRQIARQRVA